MNYKKIYDQIIERGKNRSLNGYKECHHIIPKCLGGNNDKNNLVDLTAREHFLCHWLLHEIYPDNKKLFVAFHMMCQINNYHKLYFTPSSRLVDYCRKQHANNLSGIKKPDHSIKMSGINNPMYGKKGNLNPNYGKKRPDFSKKMKGKKRPPFSQEWKKKMSLSKIGKNLGDQNPMNNESVKEKFYKKINQYDLNGNYIKSWNSIKEAGITLNIHRSNITLCCQGKYKKAGNYIWKYIN
jgi:hypothetical protein